MSLKAKLRVVVDGRGRGEKHQARVRLALPARALDQARPIPVRWCDARTARSER